jgi:hypothetical protein
MKKPLIYIAVPMSGRYWREVIEESESAKRALAWYDMDAWCPPLKEVADVYLSPLIVATREELKPHWRKDLAALNRASALISLRGDMASEGVGFEIGYAKHKLKIPVVIVSLVDDAGRVTHLEADYIAPNIQEACAYLKRKFARKAARKKK